MSNLNELEGNPLLATSQLPLYSSIEAEHVEPAIRHILAAQSAQIAELAKVENPDSGWLEALEDMYEAISHVWSPVSHLNAVKSSPELRDAYNACIPIITEFYTDLGQNRELYERFVRLRDNLVDADPIVAQVLRLGIRDFELAGVALTGSKRERFKDVMQGLAAIQATFEQNLMDAGDAFTWHITEAEQLSGIPEDFIQRAAALAEERDEIGWVFRLDPPTYQAITSHANDSSLREVFYKAWNTRASDQGPNAGKWDNGPLIEEILRFRQEAAQILGFSTFAEQSIATKMAGSTDEVIVFLNDLAKRSQGLAKAELERLETLAGTKLEPWDVGFYSEKLKQSELNLSEEALRPYFPLENVLDGIFKLAKTLFGITLEEQPFDQRWHETVQYFVLKNADGKEFGGLLTDFFARPNKRGGAWMDVCRNHAAIGKQNQVPIAQLVCNFSSASAETPALLTHSDVVTLFHEFGHSLHHLLTEVPYPSLAGINGVAWDAVELPSQFFENYAFLPEVLRDIGKHWQSGEPLPDETIATLQKSRTFLAGLAMVRQLEFALFDFLLHNRSDEPQLAAVRELHDNVRREVAVIFPPGYNRFANGFSHIFAGGYAAGYYSYKWAEVLAADSFAAFEEAGVFDRPTAERFRRAILSVGGSKDAIDAFIDFRGRAPKLEALLRQAGIDVDGAVAA